MFFAVILVKSKKILGIPANWCLNIDVVRNFNYGLQPFREKIIFYSPTNQTENFTLELKDEFDEINDACYHAQVLKAFGTMEECLNYVEKRRNTLAKDLRDGPRKQTLPERPLNVQNVLQQVVRVKNEVHLDTFIDLTVDEDVSFI